MNGQSAAAVRSTLLLATTLLVSILVGGARAAPLSAQQETIQDTIVAAQRANILSPSTEAQMVAFEAILASIHAVCRGDIRPECATNDAKRAMTDLLRAYIPNKNAALRNLHMAEVSPGRVDSEDGYLPGLIDAVHRLHDPSSLPLFYNNYILGTGGMAIRALAYFGRTEAPHIVQLYEHDHSLFSHNTYRLVILSMLEQNTVTDPATLKKIEDLMLAQASSRNWEDRSMAVEAVSFFTDQAARARLTDMSLHDPSMETDPDNTKHYDIREKAARALQHPMAGNYTD